MYKQKLSFITEIEFIEKILPRVGLKQTFTTDVMITRF